MKLRNLRPLFGALFAVLLVVGAGAFLAGPAWANQDTNNATNADEGCENCDDSAAGGNAEEGESCEGGECEEPATTPNPRMR